MKAKLLTRDEFREGVFKRDNYKCVICGNPAKDAHHIIERRLFQGIQEFGGYFIDNGASLCEEHHIKAEETTLSCEEIREKCGITNVIIPEHFYRDLDYDKWGNIMLPNGTRLKGELFNDESVQKIIKPVLSDFVKYVKYQRTYHLPWSQMGKDDRQLKDDSNFHQRQVVCTIKMDGENTTMYNDYIHARSLDSNTHPTRNWVKGLWSQISYLIDDNMRLCGENLYAKHTIKYTDLKSFFNLFSVWIDMECLSWPTTVEYAQILGLETVPVFYQGIYNKEKIIEAFNQYDKINPSEGYVIRMRDGFPYQDFRKSVAKYVKPEFRQAINSSHGHWISQKIEPNEISVR